MEAEIDPPTVADAPVALLLAAGRGSRFDASGHQAKLLALLPDGRPVAVAAAQNLLQAFDTVVAVLPAVPDTSHLSLQEAGRYALRQEHIAALTRLLTQAGCRIVFCADSDAGMAHTLAAGVRATQDANGWTIALADMPAISPAVLRAVSDALTLAGRQGIAVPVWKGRRGHPVAFGSAWRDRLMALEGDAGARQILQAYPEAVIEVSCDEQAILFDIDTADDLQRYPDAASASG